MKKLIAVFAVMAISASAQASYLYWQVDDTDNFTAISGVSENNLTYARFVLKDNTGVERVVDYAQLDNSDGPDTYLTPGARSVDISSLASETGAFSYYIELGTYSSSTWTGYAISEIQTAQTYEQIAAEAISSTATLQYADLVAANIKPFHGGTYSVPEPTSGLMLLLGAAMLGLKRKNRSVA